MKTLLTLTLILQGVFVFSFAQACPQLSGSYNKCSSDQEFSFSDIAKNLVLSQDMNQAGVTTYHSSYLDDSDAPNSTDTVTDGSIERYTYDSGFGFEVNVEEQSVCIGDALQTTHTEKETTGELIITIQTKTEKIGDSLVIKLSIDGQLYETILCTNL